MNNPSIVAGTGHRLGPRVGGYSNGTLRFLIAIADKWLKKNTPKEVISGGALGWDQALAIAAIRLEIPLTIAVPFVGQEKKWPKESQERYKKILDKAKDVVYVHRGGYEHYKMHARNEWMVNNSHLLLAYFDGKPYGGTYNCIIYAKNEGEPIVNLYQNNVEITH